MAIDDRQAESAAQVLENAVESGDYNKLHNTLLNDSFAYDGESFQKIVATFDRINQQKRNSSPELGLPDIEFTRDGLLGLFGNVSQVKLTGIGEDKQKMEVYESAGHRDAEVTENQKQSEPNHIDLGRMWSQSHLNEWFNSTTDYHTDSSVPWGGAGQNAGPGNVEHDFRGNAGVGALPVNDSQRVNSEADLEQRVRKMPAGYNPQYRLETR